MGNSTILQQRRRQVVLTAQYIDPGLDAVDHKIERGVVWAVVQVAQEMGTFIDVRQLLTQCFC